MAAYRRRGPHLQEVALTVYIVRLKLMLSHLLLQIRYISQTQGLPDDHLLTNGSKSLKFFKKALSGTTGLLEWKLKVRSPNINELSRSLELSITVHA